MKTRNDCDEASQLERKKQWNGNYVTMAKRCLRSRKCNTFGVESMEVVRKAIDTKITQLLFIASFFLSKIINLHVY